MKTPVLPILAIAGMLAACKPAAPSDTADAVARSFYEAVRAEPIHGLPTPTQLDRIRPYIGSALAESFTRAAAEQARFIRENPDEKPPWIEGDLFGSLYEGVSRWTLAGTEEHGGNATTMVSLTFEGDGQKTAWTDTLVLEKQVGGWKVTDIRMGGDWAFQAGSSTLTRTLAINP
jgi:hypothetical protein